MARPQKGGDDKRELIVRFRLTAAEKKQISVNAASVGMTTSDYIRNRILGSQPHIKKATPERADMIRMLGHLGKIGSNINQVARALNRKGDDSSISPELIAYTLQEVKTLAAHINKELGFDGHQG